MSHLIAFSRRIRAIVRPLSVMAFVAVALQAFSLSPAGQVGATVTPPQSNPPLVQACGLDVALIVDVSGSIEQSEMTQVKSALTGFANAFDGTPTVFSLSKFNDRASVVQPFSLTPAQAASAVQSQIPSAGSNYTNWDDGLAKGYSTFDPRTAKQNLIVIATDGNPNRWGSSGSSTGGESAALAKAVERANAIKAAGTRIIAIGIGGGSDPLNIDNLKAITGPNVAPPSTIDTTVDVITADFDQLSQAMSALANTMCGGKILVQKQFDTNGDGTPELDGSVSDALLSGYTFDVSGNPSDPAAQVTTDTGALEFDVLNGTYELSETDLPFGMHLSGIVCQKGQQDVGTVDVQNRTVAGLVMSSDETIACRFVNAYDTATIIVKKQVVNDDGGDKQSADFTMHVSAVNPSQASFAGSESGVTVTVQPGQYEVTEDADVAYMADMGPDCSGSIAAGETKTCVITNDDVDEPLEEVPVATCTGEGEVYLFRGNQFQAIDATFQTQRNRLLIFTRGDYLDSLSVTLNGSPVTVSMIKNISSPFPVKVFQVVTSSGDAVHVTGVSTPAGYGARAIQGFLAQDASAPAYDVSTLQVIFDDAQVNEMYLTPGNYSYIFFDKYTQNNDGTDDSRLLSVEVTGPGGTLVNESYVKPAPTGTQGTVIGSFAVSGPEGEGMHQLAITTQDSVYWPKAVCPVPTATIIVKKLVTNNNGGTKQPHNFTMNVTAMNPSQTSFPGSEAGVAVTVNPGDYNVDETELSGYAKTRSAECYGKIYGGETKTCVITNDDIEPEVCHLEIDKSVDLAVAQPGDTLTYTLNFRNVGNIPCTGGGTKVQDVVDTRLEYLSETHTSNVDAGYYGPVYDNGILRWNAHELVPGESGQVVWTARIKEISLCGQFDIPNTAQITAKELNWQWVLSNTVHTVGDVVCRATLIVKKFVINDSGRSKQSADFTMSVTAVNPSQTSFPGSGTGTTVLVDPGAYIVDEVADPDYAKSFSGDCNGAIAHGETKTCIITNDDIPLENGKLIVIKHVINDNGWNKQAADFSIDVTAAGNFQTTIPGNETGTEISVKPGDYRVIENDSLGYTVTYSQDCTGTIGEGETKTCTVTNDDVYVPPQPAHVIVIKHVSNDDGRTKTAPDFTMHLAAGSGSLSTSFPGEEVPGTSTLVPVGDFNVTEDADPDYIMTMAGDCSGTIAAGETKTCTITNDDIPPPPPDKAKLVIIKHVITDNGGTKVAADFDILVQAAGSYQNTLKGKEAPGEMIDVEPGAYTISEPDSLGYTKSLSSDCAGTVAANETKTCTITNDDPSETKLVVIKRVINNNGGSRQASEFTMNVTAVNPSQTSFPGSESGVTVNVEPGAYSVDEATPFNYSKSLGGDCSGTIALGETKTCVITNDDPGGGGGGGCTGASCNPNPSPVNVTLACGPSSPLNFTYGSDVRSITISNASDFSNATTISPVASVAWSAAPGTTVYVKFERYTGSIEIRSVQATSCGQVLGDQCIDVAAARDAVKKANQSVVDQYRGKLITAPTGELWYVDPVSGQRAYMQFGLVTYDIARAFAQGLRTDDMNAIPVGISSGFGADADGDGLSDMLEDALGTNLGAADTDGDGYDDRTEVQNGYNPLGTGTQAIRLDYAQQKRGAFLIQVEGKGELWYVDPATAKRYLIPAGDGTLDYLKGLAVAVDDSVLSGIPVTIQANGAALRTVSSCYPPVPQVLGTTDELPRTGLPTGFQQLLTVPLLAAYPYLQRRYRNGFMARYYRKFTA